MKKILLNGVDGNFGSKAAKVLLEKWPHEDLIFAAPSEKGLEKYADIDVEKRVADFNNPEGLIQAFTGVDTMVLISMPFVGPKRRKAQQTALDAAVKAGAKFIVSPGFDPEIVDYCLKKEIPVLPGCISPSEVAQAVKRGLKTVKFFPAEQAGGVAMIKAMAAPYTGIKFMPTGGINAKNLEDYLSFDKIICCGGSWMVKGELVKAGAFDKIKELTAEARNLVESIRK